MKGFKLNESGQFEFDGQNDIVMVSGDDDLVQSVRHIITTNFGEWFLNPTIGWARFDALGQKLNREMIISGVTTAVLDAVPEVSSLEDFEISWAGERSLSIKFNLYKFVEEEATAMEVVV